ncbi:unnamed protein product [Mucor hiemalis]
MISSSSKLFKNSNTSQEEGNHIFVYPTPITNSSARESIGENSILEEDKVRIPRTTASSKKKQSYFKRIQRLRTLATSYISRLMKRMGVAHSNNNQDTSAPTDANHNTCWKKKLKPRRKESHSIEGAQFRPTRLIWCFRPIGTAAVFKSSSTKKLNWTEFEKKNQVELSRQWDLLNHREAATQASFEIQDKNIFDGTVVVTIMLKEGIAFVLNPEWSQPITYRLIFRPKFRWYQEVYMRHKYRQMLRDQYKAFEPSTFP